MAGFVPGRDRVTLDALAPEESRRIQAAETADRRAVLDKEDLAELERAHTGVTAPRHDDGVGIAVDDVLERIRDRRKLVMSRVKSHPLATLLAVVSAILILFGRINRDLWWGNWIAVVGFAVLVVAGALVLLTSRRSQG